MAIFQRAKKYKIVFFDTLKRISDERISGFLFMIAFMGVDLMRPVELFG